jgi:hypothetical protein
MTGSRRLGMKLVSIASTVVLALAFVLICFSCSSSSSGGDQDPRAACAARGGYCASYGCGIRIGSCGILVDCCQDVVDGSVFSADAGLEPDSADVVDSSFDANGS